MRSPSTWFLSLILLLLLIPIVVAAAPSPSLGITSLISKTSSGYPGDNPSYNPSISGDGRYIVYESLATNFGSSAANGKVQVYLYDRELNTTTLVSCSPGGNQGNDSSFTPKISRDGRYVTFSSLATDLVSGDTNGRSDVFLWNRQNHQISRISTDSSNSQVTGSSRDPTISADGTYVVFSSWSPNLVSGDTNRMSDIFRKNVRTGGIELVSSGTAGIGNGGSYHPSVSDDGSKIAFDSFASNLVPGDSNWKGDVFVKDLSSSTLTLVSSTSAGSRGDGHSRNPSLDGPGTRVAFSSLSGNFGSNNPGFESVYVKNLLTASLTPVPTIYTPQQNGNILLSQGGVRDPVISDDGLKVLFRCEMIQTENGFAQISTQVGDIVSWNISDNSLIQVSAGTTDRSGPGGTSRSPDTSSNGNVIVFSSDDPGLNKAKVSVRSVYAHELKSPSLVPTIYSIIPSFGYLNSSIPLVITGVNLSHGDRISFVRTGHPNITYTGVYLAGNLTLPNFNTSNLSIGLWSVWVTNLSTNSSGFLGDAFEVKDYSRYIINASSSSGGIISPSGLVNVTSGGNQSFTLTPSVGYSLSGLVIDGVPVFPVSPHTFTNVTGNHSIAASFSPVVCMINASSDAGSIISPSGYIPVPYGFSQIFNCSAKPGFLLRSLVIDGMPIPPTTLYAFNNLTGNHTIRVTSNVNISNPIAGFVGIPAIGLAPLSVTFNDLSTGDDLTSWLWSFGDGITAITRNTTHLYTQPGTYNVTLTVGSPYGNSTMSKPNYIIVNAPTPTYTINATAGTGGKINPSGLITASPGDTRSFTITPQTGYEIFGLMVDGVNIGPLSAYTFSNITASHSIIASFRIIPPPEPGKHTIIATTDIGSNIQPSGIIEAREGEDKTFTIWPQANYQLSTVSVDDSSQGAIRSYTFRNITQSHTITATSTAVGLISDFTGDPRAGKPPLPVNFTDTSTGGPTSWFWRFGDGSFSTETNPTHVYSTSGSYAVSLTVKNAAGSTIKSERNYITVSDKNWTIQADSGPGGRIAPSGTLNYQEGMSETFTLVPSGGYRIIDLLVNGASQGSIATYNIPSITKDYTLRASFGKIGGDTPEIKGVSPDHGQQGSVRQDVTITGNNLEGSAQVFFTGGTTNLSYTEVRKTGQVLQVKELNLSGVPVGQYNVTVINPSGLSATLSNVFTVTGQPPSPVIEVIIPDRITENSPVPQLLIAGQNFFGGERITFSMSGGSSYLFTGSLTGTNISLISPDLTRAAAGTYTVTVTNLTTGMAATKAGGFVIEPRGTVPAPVVTGVTPSSVAEQSITPMVSVHGQNFGTGDQVAFISSGVTRLSLPGTFSGTDLILSNLSVASLNPGIYDIWVTNRTTNQTGYLARVFTVTGSSGTTYWINASANEYASIRPEGLVTVNAGGSVEFILQAKAGTTLQNLTVEGVLSPIPESRRYSFTNVNANHTLHLAGAPISGVVIAGFRTDVTSGPAPLSVRFTDTSSGSPTQWSWKFGDGTFSSEQHPVHVYTRPGTYSVSLYAKNTVSNNMKQQKNLIRVNNGNQTSAVSSGDIIAPVRSSAVQGPAGVSSGPLPLQPVLVPGLSV